MHYLELIQVQSTEIMGKEGKIPSAAPRLCYRAIANPCSRRKNR